MIQIVRKVLAFKRNCIFRLSLKNARQVTSKFLSPAKQLNPNLTLNEVIIPEKNLYKISDNKVEKRKKDKEVSTISKHELISKYKINFPLTSYSERLHHGNFEYKYISKLTTQFYKDQLNLPRDKLWVTLDCPPFANGPPHIGKLFDYKHFHFRLKFRKLWVY